MNRLVKHLFDVVFVGVDGIESAESRIEPVGTHVSRRDSLLFLLLKAVFIPMTMKAFCGDWVEGFTRGGPSLPLVRATASSISRLETVLSNDLKKKERK